MTDDERDDWIEYRRTSDVELRNSLFLRYVHIVRPIGVLFCQRRRLPRPMWADCLQESAIAVLDAVDRFDPDVGVLFSTFATQHATWRLFDWLRIQRPKALGGRSVSVAVSVEIDSDFDAVDPHADPAFRVDLRDEIDHALRACTDRERTILRRHYMDGISCPAIGEELPKPLRSGMVFKIRRQLLNRLGGSGVNATPAQEQIKTQ